MSKQTSPEKHRGTLELDGSKGETEQRISPRSCNRIPVSDFMCLPNSYCFALITQIPDDDQHLAISADGNIAVPQLWF